MSAPLEALNIQEATTAPKGTPVSGVALLSDLTKRTTQKNDPFFTGTLTVLGKSMGFKMWDRAVSFPGLLASVDGGNTPKGVVFIIGTVDNYNNVNSITLQQVEPVAEADFDESTIQYIKYKRDHQERLLMTLMTKHLSPKGYQVFEALYGQIRERFILEYAAKNHHDNVPSGLLAHSRKVGQLAVVATQMYPEMFTPKYAEGVEVDKSLLPAAVVDRDLIIIAATLHDMGKIDEYVDGEMAPGSYLTHRYYALKYVEKIEDLILELFDREWFLKFISVITQHHDEYGERAKTREAVIVHWIDMMESSMTSLSEEIVKSSPSTSGVTVRVNGKYLQ